MEISQDGIIPDLEIFVPAKVLIRDNCIILNSHNHAPPHIISTPVGLVVMNKNCEKADVALNK